VTQKPITVNPGTPYSPSITTTLRTDIRLKGQDPPAQVLEITIEIVSPHRKSIP